MADTRLAVQTPLNLVMPIKAGHLHDLLVLLEGLGQGENSRVHLALKALGNVHFAQFVFLEGGTRLGVFTIYDGDFDDYILSFVEHIGGVFNLILKHIDDGGSEVTPVEQHRQAFLQFIRKHDLRGLGQFSAYPGLRVFDVQDRLKEMPC